jgi:ubiquinone/menaquinone biosynthesis C-methylase UbiE
MIEYIDFPQFKYNPKEYNQGSIHGEDIGIRPYNLTKEILQRIPFNGTLLDVGCGSASKLPSLAVNIQNIVAIDYNPLVVAQARKNILDSGLENIHVKLADGNRLPFTSNSIDMVTYMLSPHNAKEAYRVLVDGGYVIADRVGERDKPEIKAFFKDENGISRGYRSNLPDGEVGRIHLQEFFNANFIEVSCENFFWKTKYTREGLWSLLKSTPTIENFDPEIDEKVFDLAWSELSVKGVITLTQHRVLLIAKV